MKLKRLWQLRDNSEESHGNAQICRTVLKISTRPVGAYGRTVGQYAQLAQSRQGHMQHQYQKGHSGHSDTTIRCASTGDNTLLLYRVSHSKL
eukprot:1347146-Rhodomonas_salina.1